MWLPVTGEQNKRAWREIVRYACQLTAATKGDAR
jgi:hypothetical protein